MWMNKLKITYSYKIKELQFGMVNSKCPETSYITNKI